MSDPAQRYQRLGPLGQGGQGHTHRARDSETGEIVALKLIHLRGADWKSFDLFERECRVLQSLNHPAIPRFVDSFADERHGEFGLVMELVEGRSLQQLMDEQRPVPERELWSLLEQACDVLGYLHGLHPPVIHRDIKPANLILRPDDRLALVDFGGVRVALRPEGGSTVVGTFGYMAPEQLHGEALPATDVFALGATIAALAANRAADKLPRRGLKIDLAQVLADGPLQALLAEMVQPDPDERIATIHELRRRMRELRAPPAPTATLPAVRSAAMETTGREPTTPAQWAIEQVDAGELIGATAHSFAQGLVGMLGWLGIAMIELSLMPLIVTLYVLGWSRRDSEVKPLRRASQSLHDGLRRGRSQMRGLLMGEDSGHSPAPPSRQLPPPTMNDDSGDPSAERR